MKMFMRLAVLLCLALIASVFPRWAIAATPDEQISARLDALEKDGTRVKPEFGSVWYHALGPDHPETLAARDNLSWTMSALMNNSLSVSV